MDRVTCWFLVVFRPGEAMSSGEDGLLLLLEKANLMSYKEALLEQGV